MKQSIAQFDCTIRLHFLSLLHSGSEKSSSPWNKRMFTFLKKITMGIKYEERYATHPVDAKNYYITRLS